MIDAFPIGVDRPEFLWLLALALPFIVLAFWTRRRMPLLRRLLALGIRLTVLAALVAAFAGLTWKIRTNALGVVFVVDQSASIGASGRAATKAFIESALQGQTSEDRSGIVVFGAEAMVETEPREALEFHGVESSPSPHQSDLSSGLRLGTALLPADRAQRVVLLSDGEQTRGDAASQALAATGDIELMVVEIGGSAGPDVLLEDLLAPAKVDEGAAFEVRVVANSQAPATGVLRLYRNAEFLGESPITLEGGGRAKVSSFRQSARSAGLYRYRATFEATNATMDEQTQNNQVMSTVQVVGRPRVLFAEGERGSLRHLKAVFEAEGMRVETTDATSFPADLTGLRPYEAVILADVPAYLLSSRQQRAIQSYVRDLGRGLMMLGGDQSFGVGGYYDSPVEAALPLKMDIEDKTRFPKLAMVHAIDKSCSMGSGNGSPLMLAKEAALQTVDLLSERDMLGIIGFDGAASFIVPLEELHDKQRVMDDIASIRSGGGTDIYPALERSVDALANSDAALKHIILLSDGMTAGGAYEQLLTQANRDHQITVTAIAIGSSADRTTMESFGRWGGGNYYLVTDASAIPAIFTRETLLATRSFLVEEPFKPALSTPSELIAGVDIGSIPTLGGYVATSARQRATVSLVIPGEERNEPLLAHWRYGLGRSVAYTSDARTRWSADWVGSASYTQLWGQVARYLVADGGDAGIQLVTEIQDGQLEVTVDAFDTSGDFRNFLEGEARIIAPDLSVVPLKLQQVAPGRYRASLPVDQDGSWLVGVELSAEGVTVGQAVEEAVQPYSPEYRSRGAGKALLGELARLGGGVVLTDPAQVFARPPSARAIPFPLWPWMIALAALLFVLDVAARRLSISFVPGAVSTAPASAAPPVRRFEPKRPRPPHDTPAEPVEPAADLPTAASQVDPTSYAGRLLAARKTARDKLDTEDR